MEDIAELISDIERSGAWPEASLSNKLVYLTKKSGGDRPIGLAQLIPCLWHRLRRATPRQWEDEHTTDFDTARAGTNAEAAAYSRSARNELARYQGKASTGTFWDLATFFDSVLPEVLLAEALELDYPA